MSLNHDIVGVDSEPAERTWTKTRRCCTAYFRTTSNGVPVLDKGRLTFTD